MNSRNSSTSCVAKCPSLVCYVLACGIAFFDLNLCQSCDIPTLVHVEHGPLSSVFAAVSGIVMIPFPMAATGCAHAVNDARRDAVFE